MIAKFEEEEKVIYVIAELERETEEGKNRRGEKDREGKGKKYEK